MDKIFKRPFLWPELYRRTGRGVNYGCAWRPGVEKPNHRHHRLLRARRQAWLRIFVVRCSLPCDPPVGGHACNGEGWDAAGARSGTKAGRQGESSLRITLGLKTPKAQNEQML